MNTIYVCDHKCVDDSLSFNDTDITLAWHDDISVVKSYIDTHKYIQFDIFEVDIGKGGYNGDIDQSLIDIHGRISETCGEYEIGLHSTNTIHPCIVPVTNYQLSEFEIGRNTDSYMYTDIRELGISTCRLYKIFDNYHNGNDISEIEFKQMISLVFSKYIIMDILDDGYDYYPDNDTYSTHDCNDFFSKAGIDVLADSLYDHVDEFALYKAIMID